MHITSSDSRRATLLEPTSIRSRLLRLWRVSVPWHVATIRTKWLDWLTSIHKEQKGPYLFLCAGLSSFLPPFAQRRHFAQLKVWTDLYICLCLRKVALAHRATHPYMPLFLFFDPTFQPRDIAFLKDQHFLAMAGPFKCPVLTVSAERDANQAVKAVIEMAVEGNFAGSDAQVRPHFEKIANPYRLIDVVGASRHLSWQQSCACGSVHPGHRAVRSTRSWEAVRAPPRWACCRL
jgi:hypothetical protein